MSLWKHTNIISQFFGTSFFLLRHTCAHWLNSQKLVCCLSKNVLRTATYLEKFQLFDGKLQKSCSDYYSFPRHVALRDVNENMFDYDQGKIFKSKTHLELPVHILRYRQNNCLTEEASNEYTNSRDIT